MHSEARERTFREVILQFAVYCGWPKASCFEGHLRTQWARIHQERGQPTPPWPQLSTHTLGPNDWEARLQGGGRLITVTCVAIDDAPLPLQSHVGSALKSRDITADEMAELALQIASYYGFAKGEQLNTVAQQQWARILQEEREEQEAAAD